MRNILATMLAVGGLAVLVHSAAAADNELTPKEKEKGWQLLFNGTDHTGWMCNNGKEVQAPIEDGALVPYKSGGYLVVYKKPFSDFVFKCDVKMSQGCNSGIFFRIGNLKNPVQTGFEMQVLDRKKAGRHDFGALYDLVAPKENRAKGPGEWNSVKITCKGPHITVAVNGKDVTSLNCEKWTEPGKRPDGSSHKFNKAVKNFPRKGYIGFQDHGHKVWYKNVKLLDLSDK